MTDATRELLLRFVDAIGRPDEARRYVEFFRSERPESFAIIHVADAVMRHAADHLITELRFLARLGLTPVVTFGAVDPKDAVAHAQHIREELSPEVSCTVADPGDLAAIAHDGGIPLVAIPGETTTARFAWLGHTAAALLSRKLIFLGRRHGLIPRNAAAPLSMIDVTAEFATVKPTLDRKQGALLAQVKDILDNAQHPMTIAVTSPLTMLRELFTERGAGTLVRRGCRVTTYQGYGEIDRGRLAQVIESAFGRKALPPFFERTPLWTAIADDYRGAAIVESDPLAPYLSKFAVDVIARGEGVGRDLWRALTAAHPRLFWRSRLDNPINAWYQAQCDGLMRTPEWAVFWRGLGSDEIGRAVDRAVAKPTDLAAPLHTATAI